jgi:hypothetical protein
MLQMSSEIVVEALTVSGVFTIALGIVHIAIPLLMDFDRAIPTAAALPAPLHSLGTAGLRYEVRRSDVRGIAWVMSNAASYVLVSLGIADLAARSWLATDVGRLLALWAVGWWVLRAGGQFLLGRRWGDLAIAAGFASLAIVHAIAALQ